MSDSPWKALDADAGLWAASYRVPGFPCRSIALRLSSGGYLVLSPGASLADGFAASLGEAELLAAPNSFHHLGIAAWRRSFPRARVLAEAGAHSRLVKKGVADLEPALEASAALPAHGRFMVPPTRIGEVWLRVEGGSGVIWCVGDSIFNLPSLSKKFGTRIAQRALRSAPGPSISNLMKWVAIGDRRRFKEWFLEALQRDRPTMVAVLHGDIIETRTSETLEALIRRRL